jgi:hypothetical protein
LLSFRWRGSAGSLAVCPEADPPAERKTIGPGDEESEMSDATRYSLDFANGTVELTLTDDRFVVKTEGRGLLDKLRTIDIPVKDLKNFCLVPTIGIQNIDDATGTEMVYDQAYDAEFIFSYYDGGKVKKKRVFVQSQDGDWQRLLEALRTRCPTASLLDLDPAEAQKQIGVISGTASLRLVVGFIIGMPLLIGAIVLVSKAIHGH